VVAEQGRDVMGDGSVPDVAPAVIAAEPSRAEETVLTTETVRGAVPRLPVPLPCGDGRRDVRAMADIVHLLVPDLVGLSVVVPDPATGEVRTLAATGEDVALLDAAQYLGGATLAARPAPDARWLDLRTEAAPWAALLPSVALGVGAFLAVGTRPPAGSGAGGQTAAVHVFAGRTGEQAEQHVGPIASAVGTWAERMVARGTTYPAAQASRASEPESLVGQGDIARAVARVAVQQGVDVVAAGARLREAARRAGTPERLLARLLAHPEARGARLA
jgi:hypothetical protein